MQRKMLLTALVLTLVGTGPGQAGIFDQFEDLGDLDEHLVTSTAKDAVPAMTNPEFVDPDQVTYVLDHELVLGVFMNGEARAYPENLGWWHEIINDQIGDQFISVTLCPLTGTGQVFNATDKDGTQIEFGVSGFLINSNLVLYDRRDNNTLYPQMIYTGIAGDRKNQQLELLPVVETTWAMWKQMYPDTKVTQGETGLDRYDEEKRSTYFIEKYLDYPYFTNGRDYRTNNQSLNFFPTTSDLSLSFDPEADAANISHIKEIVLGVCQNDQNKAYPFMSMPDRAVINDEVGGSSLLVVFHKDSRTAIPYRREVDGRLLSFYQVEPEGELPVEFMDVETGSRWNMLGEAIAGSMAGARLEQVPAYNAMWFAWAAYWTGTQIWSGEGIIDEPPVTAVEEEVLAVLPESFSLGQNFPNPFNPVTSIHFTLPRDGLIRLALYNAAGQKIRTLVEGHQQQSLYVQSWDGRDDAGAPVSSGIYLYRLDMPGLELNQARTMTLLR